MLKDLIINLDFRTMELIGLSLLTLSGIAVIGSLILLIKTFKEGD